MKTEIHKLVLGITNCYLIKEEGLILVDSGSSPNGEKLLKELKKLNISPKEISLLFLTHGHWDHIAGASEIKKLIDAKIAINHHEKECVEHALKLLPPGVNLWGRLLLLLMRKGMSFINFPEASVDISLEDKEFSLASFGLKGSILYTPGHTLGSMSLLLEGGDAFVGDLTMNGLPMRRGPGMPIFAEDLNRLLESWELLLEKGAKRIYPAHGAPFSSEVLKRFIEDSKKQFKNR